MCHDLQISEQNCFPLENIKDYLLKILNKTENQKEYLDFECRKACDILTLYFEKTRSTKDHEDIGNDHSHDISCSTISSSLLIAEKEIICEIDTAINEAKCVMQKIENKTKSPKKVATLSKKSPFQKDKNVSSTKIGSVKNQHNIGAVKDSNRKNKLTIVKKKGELTEVNKKSCKLVKPRNQYETTYRKDFIGQNGNVKNICTNGNLKSPVARSNSTTAELINIKDIDDVLSRVTPHPINDVAGLSSNEKCFKYENKDTVNGTGDSPYMKDKTSKELLNYFSCSQNIILEMKNFNVLQKKRSSFLSKLNERNKNLTSSIDDKSCEKYNRSLKMMSKCSSNKVKLNYFVSDLSFDGILQLLYCNDPNYMKLTMKMNDLNTLYFEEELLNLLKKEIESLQEQKLNKNIYSNSFYKMCESFINSRISLTGKLN